MYNLNSEMCPSLQGQPEAALVRGYVVDEAAATGPKLVVAARHDSCDVLVSLYASARSLPQKNEILAWWLPYGGLGGNNGIQVAFLLETKDTDGNKEVPRRYASVRGSSISPYSDSGSQCFHATTDSSSNGGLVVLATIWNGTNSSGWRGEDNLQANTACVYASSAQPRLLLLLWGRAF